MISDSGAESPTGDPPPSPRRPAERDDPAERLEQFMREHFGGEEPPESLPEIPDGDADDDAEVTDETSPDETPRTGTRREH
jgi:hypothetical protein